ncbi:UDP-galactopyranose mutase [Clostridium sp. HV4-5-A1G]|uniref:UDP-galactopyranose mutase n=1 Tax=Clostridium sp. HV4-5-A1G TaxID=2004595 RepID=UPI00123AD536|nr:UDP-galactopyranose mutase [Clostridium sp. HV4-5-A1G]KAA8665390.1 UDP-galactopyranose mutase [Clostridium sp. HV4-5-A1G]
MKDYDYLIVGSGLFGAVCAYELTKRRKKCLVIEKRDHVGGNIYCKRIEGINVHQYGAHIFHTNNKMIWNYMNQFAEFNKYINSPLAFYKNEVYNLPFNMNTFNKMWGLRTPAEAKAKIKAQIAEANIIEPKNLEEQAISLVGRDIYEKLIKGYTEKQWGKDCRELPTFIIKRLPVRFTYNNNYFNDLYQGIPIGGYTKIIEKMLNGIQVSLNTDFFSNRKFFMSIASKIIFTGMIDEFYDYCYGQLEYRSLKFETRLLDEENYQGNAVVNYTEFEIPYTRIIEHKHFEYGKQSNTVITKEYPIKWEKGDEPYYPINDNKNNKLYHKYKKLAEKKNEIIFGGRLGMYKYFDMDDIVIEALNMLDKEINAK